jgi:hypothetical protein
VTEQARTDPPELVKESDAAARNTTLVKAVKTLTVMVAVFTVVVVVTAGLNYVNYQNQQRDGIAARTALLETTSRIKDCTDPAGKCYQAGQKQTGRAIASITEAQVAAIACSQEPAATTANEVIQRNAAIAACVRKILTGG